MRRLVHSFLPCSNSRIYSVRRVNGNTIKGREGGYRSAEITKHLDGRLTMALHQHVRYNHDADTNSDNVAGMEVTKFSRGKIVRDARGRK